MIGLAFLGVAILWLVLIVFFSLKIPKWLGLERTGWLLSLVLLVLGLVGPFVDHWIGMRQFDKLCAEQTSLQIYPAAITAKRGKVISSAYELLNGYLIPIDRRVDSFVDTDTGQAIARYYHFSTPGGRVGKLVRLGSDYECAVFKSNHPDNAQYQALRKQIVITY